MRLLQAWLRRVSWRCLREVWECGKRAEESVYVVGMDGMEWTVRARACEKCGGMFSLRFASLRCLRRKRGKGRKGKAGGGVYMRWVGCGLCGALTFFFWVWAGFVSVARLGFQRDAISQPDDAIATPLTANHGQRRSKAPRVRLPIRWLHMADALVSRRLAPDWLRFQTSSAPPGPGACLVRFLLHQSHISATIKSPANHGRHEAWPILRRYREGHESQHGLTRLNSLRVFTSLPDPFPSALLLWQSNRQNGRRNPIHHRRHADRDGRGHSRKAVGSRRNSKRMGGRKGQRRSRESSNFLARTRRASTRNANRNV